MSDESLLGSLDRRKNSLRKKYIDTHPDAEEASCKPAFWIAAAAAFLPMISYGIYWATQEHADKDKRPEKIMTDHLVVSILLSVVTIVGLYFLYYYVRRDPGHSTRACFEDSNGDSKVFPVTVFWIFALTTIGLSGYTLYKLHERYEDAVNKGAEPTTVQAIAHYTMIGIIAIVILIIFMLLVAACASDAGACIMALFLASN